MPREALDSLLEQVQVAVGAKHKLIAEQQVTNEVVGTFTPEVVAQRGPECHFESSKPMGGLHG
jgi:hypothetical protein